MREKVLFTYNIFTNRQQLSAGLAVQNATIKAETPPIMGEHGEKPEKRPHKIALERFFRIPLIVYTCQNATKQGNQGKPLYFIGQSVTPARGKKTTNP
jgi:hypothetical protein